MFKNVCSVSLGQTFTNVFPRGVFQCLTTEYLVTTGVKYSLALCLGLLNMGYCQCLGFSLGNRGMSALRIKPRAKALGLILRADIPLVPALGPQALYHCPVHFT